MKAEIWLGNSRSRIKTFPKEARDIAGHDLRKVQYGATPADWRSMPGIGPGAIEIRVHRPREHRLIYVASYAEAIYVLHCFEKKTRKTPALDIDIARIRYRGLQTYRQQSNK
jgi:phage-related protein